MLIVKRLAYCLSVIFLCSACIVGCSDDKEQKQVKKTETTQEKIGTGAAQDIKKPIEEAVKVRSQVEEKQKTKLEGC